MSFCNRCPIALSASMFDLLQSFLNIVTKEQLLECVTLCHSPPQIFHIRSSLGLTSKVFTRPCRMCNTSPRRFPRSESTRLPLHVLRCHGALQSPEGTCCAVTVLSKVLKAARVLLPQGLCVDLLACIPVVYPFTSSSLCPKTFHHFAPCLLV